MTNNNIVIIITFFLIETPYSHSYPLDKDVRPPHKGLHHHRGAQRAERRPELLKDSPGFF